MKNIDQRRVDEIWSAEWKRTSESSHKPSATMNKLFKDGYAAYKKYIPNDVKVVLEVGAGTGRYGVAIAKDYPDCTVYITDIVQESLDFAKSLADEVGVENVVFQREDLCNMSFQEDMFDIVVSDGVIQHVPDVEAAMGETMRVLKPGGVVFASTMNKYNFHYWYRLYLKLVGKKYEYENEEVYTPRSLKKLFSLHGFKIISQDGFYPAYGVVRLKRYYPRMGFVGNKLNTILDGVDKLSGRLASRKLGFEIFVVGKKAIQDGK